MNKQIVLWQLIIISLGLLFVLTIREYLLDKNEIEAETAKANCIIEARKIVAETLYDTCSDIELYKLKFNNIEK